MLNRRAITLTFAAFAVFHPAAAQDEVQPLPPVVPAETPAATASPIPDAAAAEAPSAELIIDAEEEVLEEPAMEPSEQPLPPMDGDGSLPGEDNIFGADLFGGPDMFMPPMPDIPEVPPMIEDPKELERKMRVKLRRIKARLNQDPQLLELQAMAQRAPTPEDQRAARRAYYALFFEKVRKADPTLADFADKTEEASLAGLYQTRIEPTLALNPPPQPQPQERFIPRQQFPDVLALDEEAIPLP
jgi:hypothetical protein